MFKKLRIQFYLKFASILVRCIPYKWYVELMLDSIEVKGNAHSDKTVLCLPKPLFDKDFEQLSYRLRDYGWIWFQKNLFKACFSGLIPKYALKQKIYVQYLDDKNIKWEKLIVKAQILVRALKSKKGMCCLVTANIDYYQDYALKVACKREGIPVVVLQKEFPITDEVASFFKEFYENWNPNADIVAVAGDKGRDSLIAAGVGDYAEIVITGFPRIDRYLALDLSSTFPKTPHITLLSFREGYGENSEALLFDLILDMGKINSRFDLLIKAKDGRDQKIILEHLVSAGGLPANFNVSCQVPLYDAFAISSLIIGHNSLSVVEGLLTRCPIFIPQYISSDMSILNVDQCENCGVEFFASKNELIQRVQNVLQSGIKPITDEQLESRRRIFGQYWKWENGVSASERFGRVLNSIISESLHVKK